MKFRYYRNKLPHQGEVLMAIVQRIEIPYGVHVILPEYQNQEAFIILAEYIRNLKSKKIAKIGEEIVVEVTRIDDAGRLDLTKRRVKQDSIKVAGTRYKLTKRLMAIANDVYALYLKTMNYTPNTISNELKEEIVSDIVWKSIEDFDNIENLNNDIYINTLFQIKEYKSDYFDETFQQVVRDHFRKRITVEPAEYETEISVNTKLPDGLNIVKDIMTISIELDNNMSIFCVTSPIYKIKIVSDDVEYIKKRMTDTIEQIKVNASQFADNLELKIIKDTIEKKAINAVFHSLPEVD